MMAEVNCYQNDGAVEAGFTFSVAGSDVGSTLGLVTGAVGTTSTPFHIHWLATGLTPGSNTFKLRMRQITGGGTIRVRVSGGYSGTITVVELS